MKSFLVLSGRIGVILLAALLVVGITMSLVDTSATNRFPRERRGEFAHPGTAVGNATGRTDGGALAPRGERHGPREQGLGARLTFGLFGLLRNFVIIGVVALVGVGIERFFTRRPVKAAV